MFSVVEVCAAFFGASGVRAIIEYKGYIGKVEFDDETGVLHGEVVNLHDVITFEGESVQEIRQAFQESVDDYLAFCAERGEEPEKPYSGTFTVRIPPELHRQITTQARFANQSLNSWMTELLEQKVAGAVGV
ncbi:MAG: type II toxin-antitoxin system HicB family antitoxin [Caldilineaceae bacterium]|nr:type II toxin-antitoxin system HicB family antitoxin [Caldilineaceae bacterium]